MNFLSSSSRSRGITEPSHGSPGQAVEPVGAGFTQASADGKPVKRSRALAAVDKVGGRCRRDVLMF